MAAHTCDTSTQETEARGLLVQTSLGYTEGMGKDKRKGEKVEGERKRKGRKKQRRKTKPLNSSFSLEIFSIFIGHSRRLRNLPGKSFCL